MPDQLQPLIERIQKEAVDDAEAQARGIIEKANTKAQEILRDARQEADQFRKEAERDAEAFSERSKKTLDQAARDLLMSVESGVDKVLSRVVAEELDPVLDQESLRDLLGNLVESYLEKEGAEHNLEILVAPQDREHLVEHFRQRFGEALRKGVRVETGAGITKGFWVTVDNDSVSHDFTREAMVEALTSYLRPALAKYIQRASNGESSS